MEDLLTLKLIGITLGGIIGLVIAILICIENHFSTKDTITCLLICVGLLVMIVVSELAGVVTALILMIPISILIYKIQSN